MKLVGSDLPCPNLAEVDSYDGGGVKKSVAGVSTAAMMEVAATLGFESSSEGVRLSGVKVK